MNIVISVMQTESQDPSEIILIFWFGECLFFTLKKILIIPDVWLGSVQSPKTQQRCIWPSDVELGGKLETCPYQYPATTKLSLAIIWSNN